MKDDEIICRCEEVALGEIREAIAGGARTVRQVKMATRAGMGLCQGRTCRPLVEALGADLCELPDDAPSPLAFRPPVRPLTFGRLAGEGDR